MNRQETAAEQVVARMDTFSQEEHAAGIEAARKRAADRNEPGMGEGLSDVRELERLKTSVASRAVRAIREALEYEFRDDSTMTFERVHRVAESAVVFVGVQQMSDGSIETTTLAGDPAGATLFTLTESRLEGTATATVTSVIKSGPEVGQ